MSYGFVCGGMLMLRGNNYGGGSGWWHGGVIIVTGYFLPLLIFSPSVLSVCKLYPSFV